MSYKSVSLLRVVPVYVSIGVIVLSLCKVNVLLPTLLSDLGVGLLRFFVSFFSCASVSLITLVDNISIEPCGSAVEEVPTLLNSFHFCFFLKYADRTSPFLKT